MYAVLSAAMQSVKERTFENLRLKFPVLNDKSPLKFASVMKEEGENEKLHLTSKISDALSNINYKRDMFVIFYAQRHIFFVHATDSLFHIFLPLPR
jgi:hypothetical protein